MNRIDKLKAQFALIGALRDFFSQQHFKEVMTPPMVLNPGMETHIHPFRVAQAQKPALTNWYLHTSPEFHMKELLALGFQDIYTIGYSFRDEPNASHHRPQFIMLEWYRRNAHYTQIMKDCEDLISQTLQSLKLQNISTQSSFETIHFQRATIQEFFADTLKIDILQFLEVTDLKELIEKNFKDIPLPTQGEKLSWDDYYFLLFLNKVEPFLKQYPYLLLYEFPHHLSALSTLKGNDSRVCERFEIYAHGIELCNCFNELTNIEIQKTRFQTQAKEKKELYHYELPTPHILYDALERGLPTSAGIALGVERLLMVLTGIENPFWD